MDQRAFEEYVLDLLFVALKQRDKPVWEITPVLSPLSAELQPLFLQIAMEIFAMLLSANSPSPLEMDTARRRVTHLFALSNEDPTPRYLVRRLSDLILALSGRQQPPQQQQQQQQQQMQQQQQQQQQPRGEFTFKKLDPTEQATLIPSVESFASNLPPESDGSFSCTFVQIFYATDRERKLDGRLGFNYTAKRSTKDGLQYGECTVSIPARHKLGELESPSFLRFEFRPNPEKHIVLHAITTLEEEKFLEGVRQRVASSPNKEAFLFIHGYNVDFDTAARRTGQFAFDLGFVGAPILYSWPSNGTVKDYASDSANVGWTASHLESLLRLLESHSGAKKIHLIAHSMGNRAVCDALKALSYDRPSQSNPLLHHLVLAAPDIDAQSFRQLASSLRQVSDYITLYASAKDKALRASAKLHKYPRAGGVPVLVLPGVESIDASAVASDFLAHSYFASSYPLLSDIYELLADDKPASKRFALMPKTNTDGTYYMFKA